MCRIGRNNLGSYKVIAVPYVHDKLRPETVKAVQDQARDPIFYELDPEDPYAYADLLRRLWRYPCELVVNEHDVVPPPRAYLDLHECRAMWCTYPCQYEGETLTDSLGLARFSVLLRLEHPDLADIALANMDGRAWTRHGLTGLSPDATAGELARHGERHCMRPDVELPKRADGTPIYPSTAHWKVCDSMLARELRALGYGPHVHQPAARHLHFPGGAATS